MSIVFSYSCLNHLFSVWNKKSEVCVLNNDNSMDYGLWTENSRSTYNKWDGVARCTTQVKVVCLLLLNRYYTKKFILSNFICHHNIYCYFYQDANSSEACKDEIPFVLFNFKRKYWSHLILFFVILVKVSASICENYSFINKRKVFSPAGVSRCLDCHFSLPRQSWHLEFTCSKP